MTDYQDALVLENLDLVNWVIRTRISIPNRPLLTYDDFYAIGCEAICRAALKYQPDNVRDILDEACRATRADMTTAEKNQFYDKYIKTMHVDISPNGEATIVLGK